MKPLAEGKLQVTMEDPSHALALLLEHDGTRIVGIGGKWIRAPLSSCHGSGAALRAMVGCPIVDNLHAISSFTPATLQCTHMLDSARLGIVHLANGRPDRRYDVIVPDAMGGEREIKLLADGEAVQRIVVSEDFTVLEPARYAGVRLFQGLARWAGAHLDAREHERLFMIQRAAFVARGAMVDASFYYGRPAAELGPPTGSCFGSQPDRYEQAVRDPTWCGGLKREDALKFDYRDVPTNNSRLRTSS